MKLTGSLWLGFLFAVWPLAAGPVSYVLLQDSPTDSLVRVSADGKTITTIANGGGGVGLAMDGAGNYIVAAKSAILRVTRSGVVTTIAAAPQDSVWASVAVDHSGNFIVADARQPAIWRVSADGKSVLKKTTYDDLTYDSGLRNVSVVVEASGDYLLLIGGWNHLIGAVAQFYRVSPAGVVTEIPVKGIRTRHPMALVPDGADNYLFLNCEGDAGVLRLTLDGTVTKFADVANTSSSWGLTRNPETGEVILSRSFSPASVLVIRADGSAVSTLAGGFGKHFSPTAMVVDSSK